MKKTLFVGLLSSIFVFGCQSNKVAEAESTKSDQEIVVDNILTRRAVRKFTDQQVSQEQLDIIMKSASYAPSALNKQPWEVRIIQKPELVNEINDRFLLFAQGKDFQGSASRYKEPGFSVFHHAPTVIIIASDPSNASASLDVGIMLQNILLSSHALGLGTCPIGNLVTTLNSPQNADFLKAIDIPEGYQATMAVALGYPAESPQAPARDFNKIKVIK